MRPTDHQLGTCEGIMAHSADQRGQDSEYAHSPGLDLRTDVAHSARMYDYYLGGKDNFPADRKAAERVIQAYPQARTNARANRAFLGRAVRFAAQRGITQFLDIGTGIPGPGNTNQVAADCVPTARVVYVDNDPIVLTHARALLAGMDAGRRTSVLLGDLRRPAELLERSAPVLDFRQPVALLLVAVLHFIGDEDQPAALVRQLLEPLAPGSCLVLSHVTSDGVVARAVSAGNGAYQASTSPLATRSHAEVVALFDGTEPVPPGVVRVPDWRPEGRPSEADDQVAIYGGVGLKP
jgi:predicted O-methyltransferase YrrM